MFGMVLSIGILIDDAIVVVENVERIMAEEGLSPRDATYKAMGQITGAIIGISLVLTAVFIPMAFFSGSVGAIYRQFSITMVASMVFSAFLALSLTPGAVWRPFRNRSIPTLMARRKAFSGRFNRKFHVMTLSYERQVSKILGAAMRYMAIYGAIVLCTAFMFWKLADLFPSE